jgi:hypothetical protein
VSTAITKKITRHVSGYWPGWSGQNIHHPHKWTVGLLQAMLDDVRAAGYGEGTYLTPEISRDPLGLSAFRLTLTEHVADEVVGDVTA